MNYTTALHFYIQKLVPAYREQQIATQVAWWLLEKATQKNRAHIILEQEISQTINQKVEHWISQIVDDYMPVQYILGSVPFLDLEIAVRAPILIPRPETEEWCAHLIARLKASEAAYFNLLDLCSGTGCIALSIAYAFPQATITALDIDPYACELVTLNKEKNNITNCNAIESNLFDKLSHGKKYSIITANPPYVTHDEWHALEPRVKNWESPRALVARDDGLEVIEKIITGAPDYLSTPLNGIPQVWIETGALQTEKVTAMLKKNGYKQVTAHKDLYGKNRVITAYY